MKKEPTLDRKFNERQSGPGGKGSAGGSKEPVKRERRSSVKRGGDVNLNEEKSVTHGPMRER